MADELQELARRLERDAARLSAGGMEDGEAAELAETIARTAAEAAAMLDRAVRAPGPEPRAPGQSSLPVGE